MFSFVQQPLRSTPSTVSVAIPSAISSTSGSVALSPVYTSSPGGPRIAGISVDGVKIPAVVRLGKLYIPVRVLENQLLRPLLSCYPSVASNIKLPLLPSFYVTPAEAISLTSSVVRAEERFIAGVDLVVAFDNFRPFYDEIKALCAADVSGPCTGGWVQINNSVIPYVNMDCSKYLPLSIVQNAARLLTDVNMSYLNVRFIPLTYCRFLNDLCRSAGLQFCVDTTTSFIDLLTACALANRAPIVRYLPNNDPFGNAVYVEEPEIESSTSQAVEGNDNSLSGIQIIDVRGNAKPVSPESNLVKILSPRPVPVTLPSTIGTVNFRGRTVSSVCRPDGKKYLLLEALCVVFFPSIAVDSFANCIEHVLHVPVSDLSDDEERHFINLYKLPSTCLRCRKLVDLDDFDRFYPQIEYSFRSHRDHVASATDTDVCQPAANIAAVVPLPNKCINKAMQTKSATTTTSTATTTARRSRKRVCGDVIVIDDDDDND